MMALGYYIFAPTVHCMWYNLCILLWSYGSWIYNYLCNQCLSPLKLWVRIPHLWRGILDTTLCDKLFSDLRRSMVFSGYSGFLHQ